VCRRVIFYNVGIILVLALNVSSNDPLLEMEMKSPSVGFGSPFVLMVRRAGLESLAHIVNAMGLVAVLSLSSAYLYVAVAPFLTDTLTKLESGSICVGTRRPCSTDIFEKELLRCSSFGTSSFGTSWGLGVHVPWQRVQTGSNLSFPIC